MFAKILKEINEINNIVLQNKMFFHLVVLTNSQTVEAYKENIDDRTYHSMKKRIKGSLDICMSLIKKENFEDEWSKLSKEDKLKLILIDKTVYFEIRKKIKRDQICFTDGLDFVIDNNTPKEFFDAIGLSSKKVPASDVELDLFKKELSALFKEQEHEINSWSLHYYKYPFLKFLNTNRSAINWYKIEQVMMRKHQISGYVNFLIRFQNDLEKEIEKNLVSM